VVHRRDSGFGDVLHQIVQSEIKEGNNRGGKSRTAIELTRLEVRQDRD